MVSDFVRAAVDGGIPSVFRGPYRTLFYDARLYFSCYPFQATLFWMMYGLRLVFGDASFMVCRADLCRGDLPGRVGAARSARLCCRDARGQRVAWVLVALCAPMYLLSMFLYGNAMGCGLALAFLALQARAMSAGGRGRPRGARRRSCRLPRRCASRRRSCCSRLARFLRGLSLPWCAAGAGALWAASRSWRWRTRCRPPVRRAGGSSGGYEFGGSLTTLNHLRAGPSHRRR